VYVWQRLWNDDVRESLRQVNDHLDHLMVLAAEAETEPISIDWKALAVAGRPVTLVFRYPRMAGAVDYAEHVFSDLQRVWKNAETAGLVPAGVQLDFDSPTSRLQEYTTLLRQIRPKLPENAALSITALPTWLDSPDFKVLAKAVDYYVLQVHSFERPESIETPVVLCDTTRIPGYVGKTAAVGVPYYIAFPTHGYEVAYNPSGHFAGLVAEEANSMSYPPGYQIREVRAIPATIANAVSQLRSTPPPWYKGNVWFRMPVATDQRNWTLPTLKAVMSGRAPTTSYDVEIRHPEPQLAEIWLSSKGEDRAPLSVTITLTLDAAKVQAFDAVNDFLAESGASSDEVILRGRSPVGREAILVAWYRMADGESASGVKVSVTGD